MSILATTVEDWEALSVLKITSFVRSKEEWDKLVSNRGPAQSIFDSTVIGKIPETALSEFTQSLRFVKNSLGHAEYGMLRPYLSMDEIAKFFAVFGMSEQYFTDYADHYCDTGASTCYHRDDAICTSSC